jgi:hypothetical protein
VPIMPALTSLAVVPDLAVMPSLPCKLGSSSVVTPKHPNRALTARENCQTHRRNYIPYNALRRYTFSIHSSYLLESQ